MQLPPSKVIDIEDFSAPDLRPYLLEINEQEAARFGSSQDVLVPDSKQWESAMALRTLDEACCASAGRLVAGIGAGTDTTIFALARRGAIVFPVDSYLQGTAWSDVAPAGMLVDAARYCPLKIPTGHVIPVHSSALEINLPSSMFDAVFSCGSIEHLGSLKAVSLAAREIGRILKPGGVASIATEFRIEGPDDMPWFDDNVILFTPELIQRYIVEPSGLVMREPLDVAQSDRTFEERTNVVDFLQRPDCVHEIEEKRAISPNLVLYDDGFLFCSVTITLHKDRGGNSPLEREGLREEHAAVAAQRTALIAELERFQRNPGRAEVWSSGDVASGEIERLRAEIEWLHHAYQRSNAWKHWWVMRPARFLYRQIKRWRA